MCYIFYGTGIGGGASWGKQLALRPSNCVYKQYNCVPGAVITTI